MINKQVVLPKITVNKVWEWAELGKAHPILGTAAVWVADGDRSRFEDAVMRSLEAQGVASGGQVAAELTATLRIVAGATEEYYAWVNRLRDGVNGAVLLAARDDKAVRLYRDENEVVIEPIEHVALADQFTNTLIEAEPADIEPFQVPRSRLSEDLVENAPQDDGFEFTWQEEQHEPDPAVRLMELLKAKRTAVCQIYTARRTAKGKRVRCGPYSAIDIVNQGRIITYLTGPSGGDEHLRCVPGDKPTLVKELSAANAALA